MNGLVALSGRRAVLEALRAKRRRVSRVYLQSDGRGGIRKEIMEAASGGGVPVEEVPQERLNELAAGQDHRGVVAMAEPSRELVLDELLAKVAASAEPAFILVLDELKDPQNVGAILRTAEGAGAGGVVITRHRSAPLGRGIERASAGAYEHVPTVRVANLRDALLRIKKAGCWVVGADAQAPQDYTRADLARPVALVLGEEGRGLRELTKRDCDELVSIPLKGKVGSLNVSAAAAVLCFEVLRQRRDSRKIGLTEGN